MVLPKPFHLGLTASFHFAVFLKVGLTQTLSGLPSSFGLGVPKSWSYPNPFNNIAMRYRWVFCFSSVYKSKLLTQLRNKKPCPENRDRVCAQNRNRTCTSLRTLDFESSASTNSAIWAGLQYYAINENLPKYDLGIFSCSNTPLFAAFLLGK